MRGFGDRERLKKEGMSHVSASKAKSDVGPATQEPPVYEGVEARLARLERARLDQAARSAGKKTKKKPLDPNRPRHALSDIESYVSTSTIASDVRPAPLFDKYFFHSTRVMKRKAAMRPPIDGVDTHNPAKTLTLDSLLAKRGGKIPDCANAQTLNQRDYRWPFDVRSGVGVDLNNPITRKPTLSTIGKLRDSHLKADPDHAFEHQFNFPLTSLAPRVFSEKHIPYTKLFQEKVRIKRPKDYD